MSSATMDLIANGALKSIQHAERISPRWGRLGSLAEILIAAFSAVISFFLRRNSMVLAEFTNKLRVCILSIQQTSDDDCVLDPNLSIRGTLESIKTSIKEVLTDTDALIKFGGNSNHPKLSA